MTCKIISVPIDHYIQHAFCLEWRLFKCFTVYAQLSYVDLILHSLGFLFLQIGLAVGDINSVRDHATLKRLAMQVYVQLLVFYDPM